MPNNDRQLKNALCLDAPQNPNRMGPFAPRPSDLPPTTLSFSPLQPTAERYANTQLNRMFYDSLTPQQMIDADRMFYDSLTPQEMIDAVCRSDDFLRATDPNLIQMLSNSDFLDTDKKKMLLSLLDLLTSDPKKYMEIRNTRNNETG